MQIGVQNGGIQFFGRGYLPRGKEPMQLCVLGSGSSGNCIYIQAGATKILIDAGLSGRETERRLEQIGIQPGEIQAICLTHEHSDHVAGLPVLYSRHHMALYANRGTVDALQRDERRGGLAWNIFTTGAPFRIGELQIEPFAVSHDAYEPVGFILTGAGTRAGVVTDIGVGTHLVRERLRGCRVVVLESNHDEEMLSDARRPEYLKQRIRGRQGHLSNRHAAEMLAEIGSAGLEQVFLAHISADCNLPELAVHTVGNILAEHGLQQVRVTTTFADRVSEMWRAGVPAGSAPATPAITPAIAVAPASVAT